MQNFFYLQLFPPFVGFWFRQRICLPSKLACLFQLGHSCSLLPNFAKQERRSNTMSYTRRGLFQYSNMLSVKSSIECMFFFKILFQVLDFWDLHQRKQAIKFASQITICFHKEFTSWTFFKLKFNELLFALLILESKFWELTSESILYHVSLTLILWHWSLLFFFFKISKFSGWVISAYCFALLGYKMGGIHGFGQHFIFTC